MCGHTSTEREKERKDDRERGERERIYLIYDVGVNW
jgi:hypothetical protein